MWKRLQLQKPRPAIGEPVLLETTLDESTYGSSSTGFGIKQRPVPQRGESDDTLRSLPDLHIDPTESQATNALRSSQFRPASSIYSQPSPRSTARFTRYNNPSGISYQEVSPPSSPEYDTFAVKPSQHQYVDEQDVSPIDEMPDVTQLDAGRPQSKPVSSNIPSLRREKRRDRAAVAAADLQARNNGARTDTARLQAAGETRFDRYTGEPTTSDKGGRLGVKPGHFQPPALRSVNANKSQAGTTAAPKAQASFSDRLKNLGKSAPPSTAGRPEWKGSSGRVALVSPVQDQFDQAPLSMPLKSNQRVDTPPVSPINSPVSAVRSGVPETVAVPASMPADTDPTVNAVSPNSGRQSPHMTTTSSDAPESVTRAPTISQNSKDLPSRLQNGNAPTRTRDTVPTEAPSTSNNNQTKSTDAIGRQFDKAIKELGAPLQEPQSSQLSVTNYAVSTAESTLRSSYDSDRPSLPSSQSAYEQSILNRRRPRIMESPKPITRKQVGSGTHFTPNSPIFISMREGRRSSGQSSVGKNLPITPAEAASRDLISSLQAQIDDSAHRLRNIQKSIRQMTELMPTDHVLLTEEIKRKREMEKIKIEKLKEEEADVRRLEHDLGLKLHRAYKRRDKDAVYEPTAFWVRRATG